MKLHNFFKCLKEGNVRLVQKVDILEDVATDNETHPVFAGYWIKQTGEILPVNEFGSHKRILYKNGMKNHNEAYDRGWLRMSNYKDHITAEVDFRHARYKTLYSFRSMIQRLGPKSGYAISFMNGDYIYSKSQEEVLNRLDKLLNEKQ